ncbi:MAG: VWA domain-containing protein [Desulfobacterales bacterium]|nr:VWA domain-containing protein [Desulfobacterales bacterium]
MPEQNQSDPSPAGDGLIANVIRFTHLLRAHDIPVSFASTLDAVRALARVDLPRVRIFYEMLRCNLLCRKEHLPLFDVLFRNFWLDEKQTGVVAVTDPGAEGESDAALSPLEEMFRAEAQGDPEEAPDEDSIEYSPFSSKRKKTPRVVSFEESEAIFQAMSRLVKRLPPQMSRRYQYTLHGKKISLRRLLKKNMQFGGELILLDYKKKKVKKRRIVIFCDVSGSMDVYTLMAFQFIHALKRIIPRTEIFFFSTDLTRVTPRFQEVDFLEAVHTIPPGVASWGGGTRIGHCFKTFNDTYGREWLSNKTIIMIFSDGWDRGEIDLLHDQMAFIKQKAYKIIWLNPLLGSAGYQPICRGMKTALPFLDYFLSARRLHDFQYLEKVLKKTILG